MRLHEFLRRAHRVVAILLLLSMPAAGYASFTGDPTSPSFWVYVPLAPLFLLIITGTYMLVRPWILSFRARAA
jgi:hypothetical protein